MRLTLRLLALALLLSVASFTSMLSPVSKADDSACTDGCRNGYDSCLRDCPVGQNCSVSCSVKLDTCTSKCGPGIAGQDSE
ncbi:MAG: hypothetical protein QOH71_944 [Blastocatellia bacterium]|jgi:hypothetical protein|nr:hypothetical protein [Blastocatellia bacterium]